jgi:putative membrane protein
MRAEIAGACVYVLVMVAVPAMLRGQKSGSEYFDTGAQKMMKSGDATFAMKASQGGIAEVKLGRLAIQRAGHSDVKALGQKMADDHSKANDSLKAAAAKVGMTLPDTMNANGQALYQKLSHLTGAAFDRAYTRAMVKDHEEDIKQFQREAAKGTNPDIKAFAVATLQILQQHLEMARSAGRKVSSGGS